jgi:hypothetical protein
MYPFLLPFLGSVTPLLKPGSSYSWVGLHLFTSEAAVTVVATSPEIISVALDT